MGKSFVGKSLTGGKKRYRLSEERGATLNALHSRGYSRLIRVPFPSEESIRTPHPTVLALSLTLSGPTDSGASVALNPLPSS